MTLLLAGHETTANALAWAGLLLGRNPAEYARLRDECDRALGGRTPGFEDLPRLPYATQVFKESMRLYPPAYLLGRIAERDFTLGGEHRVAAGTTLMVNVLGMHRRGDYFAEPERFSPERFEAAAEKALPRGAFLPFGGGPRVCIGAGFAMMEATLLLATIAQRFRMHLAPNQRITPMPSITLRPRNGIRVKLEKRANASVAAEHLKAKAGTV
jgi:cytochrome P450